MTFKEFYYKDTKKKRKQVRRFAAARRLVNPQKFSDVNLNQLQPVDPNRGIRGDAAL